MPAHSSEYSAARTMTQADNPASLGAYRVGFRCFLCVVTSVHRSAAGSPPCTVLLRRRQSVPQGYEGSQGRYDYRGPPWATHFDPGARIWVLPAHSISDALKCQLERHGRRDDATTVRSAMGLYGASIRVSSARRRYFTLAVSFPLSAQAPSLPSRTIDPVSVHS